MIHFLRHIRQNLLKSGQVSKYLLYAIGEITLVMIGILLAVQINTWNNNRIEKKEEQFIYQRLIQDLEQDIRGLESSISNFEARLLYGAEALKQLNSTNLEQVTSWKAYSTALKNRPDFINSQDITFGNLLFRILVINLFYPTDNTFQELVSSGKIDIIKDKELKSQIQSFYPSLKRQQNFQDNIIYRVQSNYRDALERNNISYLNKQSFEELMEQGMDVKEITAAIENLLSLTNGSLRNVNEVSLIGRKRAVEQLIRRIELKIKE